MQSKPLTGVRPGEPLLFERRDGGAGVAVVRRDDALHIVVEPRERLIGRAAGDGRIPTGGPVFVSQNALAGIKKRLQNIQLPLINRRRVGVGRRSLEQNERVAFFGVGDDMRGLRPPGGAQVGLHPKIGVLGLDHSIVGDGRHAFLGRHIGDDGRRVAVDGDDDERLRPARERLFGLPLLLSGIAVGVQHFDFNVGREPLHIFDEESAVLAFPTRLVVVGQKQRHIRLCRRGLAAGKKKRGGGESGDSVFGFGHDCPPVGGLKKSCR